MPNNYIYDYLYPVLWKTISKALQLCVSYQLNRQTEDLIETNPNLITCFDDLLKIKPKPDEHITEGLYSTHQKRRKVYPRILKLTLKAFKEAQEIHAKGAILIPSPLYIIYHLFIVPQHSYTAAYSFTSCCSFLYHILHLHPIHPHIIDSPNNIFKDRLFSEKQVMRALSEFESFEVLKARWPKETFDNIKLNNKIKTPEIQSFVGHILASKGIAHLWFKDKDKNSVEEFLSFANKNNFSKVLRKKMFSTRFRRSSRYREFPEWGEIINLIYGFPFPVKGADVVFFGGLKPSSKGGLILSISGRAGVGKTSMALSMADAFSPFGTRCFYISLEEEIEDIEKRILSLRPHVENDLSYFNKSTDWFYGYKYPETIKLNDFNNELEPMSEKLNDIRSGQVSEQIPSICPYIIVIDNIAELFSNEDTIKYEIIENFIQKCRNLNAIVILICPAGLTETFNIEYMVDVEIELQYKDIDKENAKPFRIFNLYKTRHQLSRQGSHLFHLTGSRGFRIIPQIPSQIDRKEKIQRNLHDDSKIIHILNFLNNDVTIATKTISNNINNNLDNKDLSRKYFLKLFPRTHLLIHGMGSSGKAGFAIKLLLTPPINSYLTLDDIKNIDFSHLSFRRKILIISFLYPEKYYTELIFDKKDIHRKIKNVYSSLNKPIVDFLTLYPGYLSPQDFLNKVTRKLDEAELRGDPFTGVLIDGLHNVFLQFEKLQNSNMVWPMLYNILARYNLTVVSTFTNFSVSDRLIEIESVKNKGPINSTVPDYLSIQKGMSPFYHALVKASDYYFILESLTIPSTGSKKYLLAVRSAINQPVPDEYLEWDRENNMFIDVLSLNKLTEFIETESDKSDIIA